MMDSTRGAALDHYDGPGVGTILVMVDLGWYGGVEPAQDPGRMAELETENTQLRSQLDDISGRLDRPEALVLGASSRPRRRLMRARNAN